MATKVSVKTTFEATKTIEPIYSGGDVSPNRSGSILATCVDEDVLLVDVKTGKVLCQIEGDGEAITSLCLGPNSSHLVVCSRSLSLRIFSLSAISDSNSIQASLSRTFKPHNTPVVSSAIDDTDSLLATGGSDGSIKVWDIRGGYASHTFHGHGGVVSALMFFQTTQQKPNKKSQLQRKRKSQDMQEMDVDQAPSSKSVFLASGGEDGKIRIWDLASRKSIATLDSHVSVVRSLQYSESQQLLLSASRDRTLILWDSRTWEQTRVIPALEVLESAGFVFEGKYCYAGGEHGAVRIWSTESGREVVSKPKPGLENDAIVSVVAVTDDDALLSVHQDQTMRLQGLGELKSLAANKTISKLPVLRTISGNYDEVIDLACVGPDRSLLALATNTESLKLISIAEGTSRSKKTLPFGNDVALLEGHEDIIICVDVDWSGYWVATGAKDNTARLWRLDPASSSYTCFAVLAGHTESLGAIALPRSAPSEGPALRDPLNHPPAFVMTGSQDKTVKRWDTSKLKVGASSDPHTNVKALFTRVAHEKDINAIDVCPTAPLFASASQDRTIKIWSTEDGSVAGILRGHKRGVWSVRFSPAGTPPISLSEGGSSGTRGLLVSGSGDRTVKIWSLATYTCLQTFEGHSNSVLKVVWIPPSPAASSTADKDDDDDEEGSDRRRPGGQQPMIASAGADTLIKLWSPYATASSDPLLATLDNHTDRVWALTSPASFVTSSSPSSSSFSHMYPLISGAADATLTFWRDTTAATASAASQRAHVRITQDQTLQNHIRAQNYREAITLALSLNHPARLLGVFTSVVNQPETSKDAGSITGSAAVDDVLGSLDATQLLALLERVRDWNTNARTAGVAQAVLHCVLRAYPAETFAEMARNRATAGVKPLLRALEVYTERHFRRVEELVDEGYILEYTLREMDEVAGTGGFLENGTGRNGEEDSGQQDVIMV